MDRGRETEGTVVTVFWQGPELVMRLLGFGGRSVRGLGGL